MADPLDMDGERVATAPRPRLGDLALDGLASAPDPTALVADVGGRTEIWWINRAFSDIARSDPSDLVGNPIDQLLSCPFGSLPLNDLRLAEFPASVLAVDASTTMWVATAVPLRADGNAAWLVSLRPPVDDRHLDDLLRASEERFSALAERAPIGIFSSEVGLRLGYVNDFLAELVGVPVEQLLGTGWMSYIAEDQLDTVRTGLLSALGGASFESPVRLNNAAGSELWVNLRAVPVQAAGSPAAFLGTIEDVTDRRRFEEVLAWQATHDPLTSLPNRAQLSEEIDAALAGEVDDVAVLFFDLDDFKRVNDSLGHRAGDDLLVAVTSRLRAAVRETDRVFRFGGDEFVVLARGATNDEQALAIADRLRGAVAQPVILEGGEFAVRCSVGVVRAGSATSAQELIREADVAMYEAKRNGKGSSALFDASNRENEQLGIALIDRVRDAVADGEIYLAYQPIVEVATGRPVGVEALLRWNEGDRAVSPGEVVTAAEEAGIIGPLTEHLIDQACVDLAAWRAGGEGAPDWVSINLSAAQLEWPGVVEAVTRSLLIHQLGSADLRVEVPEIAWLGSDQPVDAALRSLLDIGIGVLLDDVGASVTSLTALLDAPISGIKLDPRLVFDDRPGAIAVTRAVIAVAAELGLDVVAEGAEDDHDLERVEASGSTLSQGFALLHPIIAAAVPSIFGGSR